MPLWPPALGGDRAPAIFRSGAFCQPCSALSCRAIDGAVLKGWFGQGGLARAAQALLDPLAPGPAPLAYLGVASDFPAGEGEVCDRWSGLAGEQIHHIHGDDGTLWTGPGGSDDAAALMPRERAIIVLTSPSRYWSRLAILSMAAHFPHADCYCLHEFAEGLTGGLPVAPLGQLPDAAQAAWIRDRGNRGKLRGRPQTDDGSHRFLIKLALGLGLNLLGPAFLDTPSCRLLRRGFWEPQPRARKTAFPEAAAAPAVTTGDAATLRNSLHWPGAWTLCLGMIGAELGLIVAAPHGRLLDIVICGDSAVLEPGFHARWREPQVFVAIPQRGIFAGPVALAAFVAHREREADVPELARLEALAIAQRMLPSKQGHA